MRWSLLLLMLPVTAVFGQVGKSFIVSDFESGISDWVTNDAIKYYTQSKDTPLISLAHAKDAQVGQGCLEITFNPGEGWSGAYIMVSAYGDQWADAGVDEFAFWMKGDGQDKVVNIDIQAWNDQHQPTFWCIPMSLKDTSWHEVVIPLSQFQAANPQQKLRLPSLHAFQVDSTEGIAPAKVWIDNLVVRNANDQGVAFAAGPVDDKLALLPQANGLPRFGMWGLPYLTPEGLEISRQLGYGFGSNGDSRMQQQLAYVEGISSNHCPGRPVPEAYADLGLTEEDFDQDAQGNRTGEGVESAVFSPAVLDRFCQYVKDQVHTRKDAKWVSSFMLSSPISMYGEVHYAASTTGQYAVFSRPAKANFQGWLKEKYHNDLSALGSAWGQKFSGWEEIVPPLGPENNPTGVDTRRCWSDFMHWYNWWLEEVTRRGIEAARNETDKPIAVMIGGPKIGLSQGIALGNIGPIVKMLGQTKPGFFSDTDSQTLFSCMYTRTACSQYGINLMLEHVGPPYLHRFHQYNMALNILASGADSAHLAQTGQLYDKTHWFFPVWKNLAPLVHDYRPEHVKTEAAMFHSYLTSWYRTERSNGDCVRLYDSTNTLWFPEDNFPSWGRALGTPDVVDDVMLEDGALAGRKLLVIPNFSVTVTSRKAVEALRQWVNDGGTLVGFGEGCLAYTIEDDNSVTATPGMAGMISPEILQPMGADIRAKAEVNMGKGRVVLYRTPASDGQMQRIAMNLLEYEMRRAGVRQWCQSNRNHAVNLIYAGRDKLNGKHLFVADFTQSVKNEPYDEEAKFWTDRTFTFTFDPSLTGEAELIGLTNSFENCEGGQAQFDLQSHILKIQFNLPQTLKLTFGKAQSK